MQKADGQIMKPLKCENEHKLVIKYRTQAGKLGYTCKVCKTEDIDTNCYYFACEQNCDKYCVFCFHLIATLSKERMVDIINKKRERDSQEGLKNTAPLELMEALALS